MSSMPPLSSVASATSVTPVQGAIAPALEHFLDEVETSGSPRQKDLGRTMRSVFATPAAPTTDRSLAHAGPVALQHGAMVVLGQLAGCPVGQALVIVSHQVLPLLNTPQQRAVAEKLVPFDSHAKPAGAEALHWQPLATGTSICDGEFTIDKPLGAGAFGGAYRAHTREGVPVVVKELLETDDRGAPVSTGDRAWRQTLFGIENRILLSSHIEAMPRGYGMVRDGARVYLVMAERGVATLAQAAGWTTQDERLAGGLPRVAPERVLKWGIQLAGLLSDIHTAGRFPIIHKDLRPQNATVNHRDDAEALIDFGLSKAATTEQAFGGRTEFNPYSGTYGFIPLEQYQPLEVLQQYGPEMVSHLGPPDQRSDIHALGMTLYALLTGVNPEKAEGLRTPQLGLAFAPDANGNYPLMVGVPLELRPIIAKMTRARPEERYQTAREVLAALHDVPGLTSQEP